MVNKYNKLCVQAVPSFFTAVAGFSVSPQLPSCAVVAIPFTGRSLGPQRTSVAAPSSKCRC